MAMVSLRLLSFLFFLLNLNLISPHGTYAQQNFLKFFCGNGPANGTSTYQTNLRALLLNISSNTQIDYGFYNFSYGKDSDKVNAIGLCRGDVKVQDCRSCLSDSRVVLPQVCAPNVREAIGWYDNCMMRFSNRTIFGVMETSPYFYLHNTEDVLEKDEFKNVTAQLMNFLKVRAASGNSLRKFAAANTTSPSNRTIYGLAQCTPDLSSNDCSICLEGAISDIPKCCDGMKGGRVVRPSCNIRYETYSFFDPAAAQPFLPSPLSPPSPPPFAHPPSKQGNSNTSRIVIAIVVTIVSFIAVLIVIVVIYLKARRPKIIEKLQNEVQELRKQQEQGRLEQEQIRLQQQQINAATTFLLQHFQGQLPPELASISIPMAPSIEDSENPKAVTQSPNFKNN